VSAAWGSAYISVAAKPKRVFCGFNFSLIQCSDLVLTCLCLPYTDILHLYSSLKYSLINLALSYLARVGPGRSTGEHHLRYVLFLDIHKNALDVGS
jgi:hypothetical protein